MFYMAQAENCQIRLVAVKNEKQNWFLINILFLEIFPYVNDTFYRNYLRCKEKNIY